MKRAERYKRTNTALADLRLFPDESDDQDDPTTLLRVEEPPLEPKRARVVPPPPPRSVPTPPPPAPPPLTRATDELREGTLFREQYMVERVVGNVGSSVVVKVRHARLGRRFLLKHLSLDASSKPHMIERFERATRAAMRLRSEHTARIVDAGRLDSGAPYLVTDAFHGSELREILRVRGAVGTVEAVDLVLQAAHAVAEAHGHALLHGSLSPSTVFVTTGADGLPFVKVLDFGSSDTLRGDPLAVRLRNWTQGTAIFWESTRLWDTLAYSAPEQVRGSTELTRAVDIWALGAILYEMLVGSPPFRGSSTTALMASIVADAPLPTAALPQELEALVSRCLEKSSEARFRSVSELAAALRPFASAEGRLTADRIVRMLRHEPGHAAWSSSNGALRALASSRVPVSARSTRSFRYRSLPTWMRFLLLTTLGALGGVLAGTMAVRALAGDGRTFAATPTK